MTHCDSTCSWCARNWWAWLKAREAQMSMPRKAEGARPAETTSFAEAARTSVRPPRPWDPCTCEFVAGSEVKTLWGTGKVLRVGEVVGLDGRHWVKVDVRGWSTDHPCTTLG